MSAAGRSWIDQSDPPTHQRRARRRDHQEDSAHQLLDSSSIPTRSISQDSKIQSDVEEVHQADSPMEDKVRGFAAIGLDNPKCMANVGGAMRAAGCYGAAMVAMSGRRFAKAPTDVKKQYRMTPVIETEDLRLVIPYDCVPVAIDLVHGAKSLVSFSHPERAFYIFGAEDATLGDRVLSWCRDVVYVPTNSCMNLAATVNVVLYDRMVKMGGDAVRTRFSNGGQNELATD